jgi:hypothetical protein
MTRLIVRLRCAKRQLKATPIGSAERRIPRAVEDFSDARLHHMMQRRSKRHSDKKLMMFIHSGQPAVGVRAVCTISKRYDRRAAPYWWILCRVAKISMRAEKSFFVLGCIDETVLLLFLHAPG